MVKNFPAQVQIINLKHRFLVLYMSAQETSCFHHITILNPETITHMLIKALYHRSRSLILLTHH